MQKIMKAVKLKDVANKASSINPDAVVKIKIGKKLMNIEDVTLEVSQGVVIITPYSKEK